jgi:hypothetical protein
MQPKLLSIIAVAIALGIAVVFADRTFEWAIVGMLASILAVLAYDAWR